MGATALQAASRPRDYVGVAGPDAAAYLQRMVSNDVEALGPGRGLPGAPADRESAHLIAPLVVLRARRTTSSCSREPGLGAVVARELTRFRFAAKCSIEPEEHSSTVVLGGSGPAGSIPTPDYGVPAYELLDAGEPAAEPIEADELERLRILARTPAWGRELDDRVLPAEAGLDERAISFTKGCYPGQEPVARLHYRGHPNRGLRVLELEGDEPAALRRRARRSTASRSAASRAQSRTATGGVLALAFVRREVPRDALLQPGPRAATQLHSPSPRP